MANHGWIHLLNAAEMAAHRVKVRTKETVLRKSDYPHLMAGIKEDKIVVVERRVKPATPRGYGEEHSLSEWIEAELKVVQEVGLGEELVGNYLIENEPGMVLAGDFRHEWTLDEDLRELTQGMRAARRRLGIGRRPNRTQRGMERAQRRVLRSLPSPLGLLRLKGWLFLLPEDMEGIKGNWQNKGQHRLHHYEEWGEVFEMHAGTRYDAVAVIYTSVAYV
jgi:hypothetical protein